MDTTTTTNRRTISVDLTLTEFKNLCDLLHAGLIATDNHNPLTTAAHARFAHAWTHSTPAS